MTAQEKIAQILRVDHKVILDLEKVLSQATGKSGVFESISADNDLLIRKSLDSLNLGAQASSKEIFDALTSKIEADDSQIFTSLELDGLVGFEHSQKIVDFLNKNQFSANGFFLKQSKAREFLKNVPPKNIMKALGYISVDDLLAKEDLTEIYCALRFIEDGDWLNNVFLKQYETLSPNDFEHRPLVLKALPDKWGTLAKKFESKKYHNISHLKELGVIFIIPIDLKISGEVMRTILLLFHYFNELQYYSNLFERFSSSPDFASKLISLLRGDVMEYEDFVKISQNNQNYFLIIQRYLAKLDSNDRRLFIPHINPEAFHWKKAEKNIVKLQNWLPDFKDGLDFWENLGWVGDYFKDESGVDTLVSFDIVDMTMSLALEQGQEVKYLYHHQEALWNEIFFRYFGEEKVYEMVAQNILNGYFKI